MKCCILKSCFLFLSFMPLACSSGANSQRANTPVTIVPVEEIKTRTDISPEELLLQAEYSYRKQNFSDALQIVQKVIIEHAETVHADRAYFIKGNVYFNILNFDRDLKKAAAAYRMVIASIPESDFDKKAQAQLEKIQKK